MNTKKAKAYKKRPEVVEAVVLTRYNVAEVVAWSRKSAIIDAKPDTEDEIYVLIPLENVRAEEGYYIVKEDDGTFVGLTPEAFEAAYVVTDEEEINPEEPAPIEDPKDPKPPKEPKDPEEQPIEETPEQPEQPIEETPAEEPVEETPEEVQPAEGGPVEELMTVNEPAEQ